MRFIWGKGLTEQMNLTLAFAIEFDAAQKCELHMAALSAYKIYTENGFIAFGPQRAAHGYARTRDYAFVAKRLVVEVNSPYCRSYYRPKQTPFFACELKADGKVYGAEDFICYRNETRVQKVQRYDGQRGFAEAYKLNKDDFDAYFDGSLAPIPVEDVAPYKLLPSYVSEPKYELLYPTCAFESGAVDIDDDRTPWRQRADLFVGTQYDGYKAEEWEDLPTDEVCKFIYLPNEQNGAAAYSTVDFGRSLTGFIELSVTAVRGGKLYFIFDEVLGGKGENGETIVDFTRNNCANVFKWTFEKSGQFKVSTFDPYTVRYARIVYTEGISFTCAVRTYENPDAEKYRLSSDDDRINKIIEAARNTFAQNAADILTDCPSRERAGWLADSYFSSEAEYIFCGNNAAEKTFLENYALSDRSGMPEGIIPMCYPADTVTYIPNWNLWYVLEVAKYASRYGYDDVVNKSLDTVRGVLSYFEKKENEVGLLENLEGWVFVEWSAANDGAHLKGVNVPSNFCYAAVLDAAAELLGDKKYSAKADKIREFIKKEAYNGEFFVDNLIREGDRLVRTEYITEVCQYYGFWFDGISKEDYPALYDELMNNLGIKRKEGYRPEIATSNVMFGLYMRIDLLMREGDGKAVLDECLDLFLPMAEKTGTLWEHNGTKASCNHGFSSYAVKWLRFALTGQRD